MNTYKCHRFPPGIISHFTGYIELGYSKLKKDNGFLKPNFGLGPTSSTSVVSELFCPDLLGYLPNDKVVRGSSLYSQK